MADPKPAAARGPVGAGAVAAKAAATVKAAEPADKPAESTTLTSADVATLPADVLTPSTAPKGFQPKIKRIVTVPPLSMKAGDQYFVKFLTKIELSKVQQKPDKDGKKQDPAHVAQVVILDSGEARLLIVNAVLMSIMHEEYPNEGYVGKGFQIQVEKPKDGKRYKGFSVAELEL